MAPNTSSNKSPRLLAGGTHEHAPDATRTPGPLLALLRGTAGRLPLGYRVPESLRAQVRTLSTPSTAVMVASALGYLSTCVLAALGMQLAWNQLTPGPAVIVSAVLALLVARQMRGLECLVHEGSHYNWYRRDKRLNDLLVNLLAAWPVLSDVRDYRAPHLDHHNLFGTQEDRDLARYRKLGIDQLRRGSAGPFILGLLRRMPRYWSGWFSAIGVNRVQLPRTALWHAVVFLLPGSLLLGATRAAGLWVAAWLAPMMLLLPILRFVGEAGEHRYPARAGGAPDTVFDATLSNLGGLNRLLFHPFGDGHHVLHHVYPSVPGYQLGRLHRLLLGHDAAGYGRRLPQRQTVLSEPAELP